MNTEPTTTAREPQLADLVGAKMPADRGLTGLGLLMQVSGSVFLALGAYFAVLPLLDGSGPGDSRLIIFLIGVLSAIRSISHRSAGMALLYGHAKGYMRGINMYCGIALAQSVSASFLLLHLGAPGKVVFFVFALLMTWPLTLLGLLSRKRFRSMGDVIPPTEDMGFESAAVFMTIFGMMGTFATACVLLSIFNSAGSVLTEVPGILLTGVVLMLLARSILHLRAGWQGVSGIDSDKASQSASAYFNFGVMSAVISAAFLMLQMLMESGGLGLAFFIIVAMAGYLLLTWPTALRMFFTDRNFSMLLDEGKTHRRAADTGLTALGWILLGTGALSLVHAIGGLLLFGGELDQINVLPSELGAQHGAGQWISLGLAALQTYAGLELIAMGDRHRIVATIFGAVSVLAIGIIYWPMISELDILVGMGPLALLSGLGPVFFGLPLAVATIVLVNRNSDPDAKARITP